MYSMNLGSDMNDLRETAYQILEIAKENLQNDGYLQAGAFLMTDAQMLICPIEPFQNENEKTAAYQKVISAAREHDAHAIITLNDAHMGKKGQATAEWLEGYYWGKLAAEGADECILMTVSGPAIANWTVTVPYTRAAERILFAEPIEETGGELAVMRGWACEPARPA